MSEENRPVQVFGQINPDDKTKLKEAFLNILDMVRIKIEEGQVDSLLFVMVAPDPKVGGDKAYTGSRFIVSPRHLDLVDDAYRAAIDSLADLYGYRPEDIRKMRADSSNSKR
jgi:hypothetical protein